MGSISLLPGDLPNPGIKPRTPTLQADSLPAEPHKGSVYWVLRPIWGHVNHLLSCEAGTINTILLMTKLRPSLWSTCPESRLALWLPGGVGWEQAERLKRVGIYAYICIYVSVSQFSLSVLSDSLQPHGLQHPRLLCLSPTPRACSKSCRSNWWCHPTILSSVIPFSSCLQSFPASGSYYEEQMII